MRIKTILKNWKLQTVVVLVILLGATAYAGVKASATVAYNSDALVSTYLAAEPYQKDGVYLGTAHSNLFKIPILALQGQHFTYHSFVILNLILLGLTIFGWIILLAAATSWRNLRWYGLGALFLVAGTSAFVPQVIYPTIRNIDYPLMLLFVLAVARFIVQRKWLGLLLYAPIYTVVAASDQFMIYVLMLVMVVVTALAWLQTDKKDQALRKRILIALAVLVISTAVARFLPALLAKLHVIKLFDEGGTAISSIPSAWQGVLEATQRLLALLGVDTFNQIFGGRTVIHLLFLLVAMLAVALFVRRMPRWIRESATSQQSYMLAVLGLSAAATFVLYVLSGKWSLANTQRYMTLIPLCLIAALPLIASEFRTWLDQAKLVSAYQKKALLQSRGLAVVLVLVYVAGFGILARGAQHDYAAQAAAAGRQRAYYNSVISVAQKEHVQVALTGFWQASPLEFWSDNKIKAVPVLHCNWPMPVLAYAGDYKPDSSKPTMLVVDWYGTGRDGWDICLESKKVDALYGDPAKTYTIQGPAGPVQLWIYNSDVRQHVDESRL